MINCEMSIQYLLHHSTLPLVEDTVLARSVAMEFMAWSRELALRGPGLEPLVWGLRQRRLAADEEGEKPGEAVRSSVLLVLLMALDSSFSSWVMPNNKSYGY